MKSTSMASLSETLQQRLRDDQQAVNQQTTKALQQHATALAQLCADALSTSKGAISSYSQTTTKAIQSGISEVQRQADQDLKGMREQAQEMKALHAQMLKRMRSMLLWPLAAALVICVLTVGTALSYSWWTVSQAQAKAAAAVLVQEQRIRRIEADFCATPAGQKICKKG